jgi:hypothetical protein
MENDDRPFESQVEPWPDQELVDEDVALARMEEVFAEARDAGTTAAARLAVIAIANYAWQSQDWPKLIDRANAMLDEIEAKQSRRWGKVDGNP